MGNEDRNEEAGREGQAAGQAGMTQDGQAGGVRVRYGEDGFPDLTRGVPRLKRRRVPRLTLAERMVEYVWPSVMALNLSNATRVRLRAMALAEARVIVKHGNVGRNAHAVFRGFIRGYMLGTVGLANWERAVQTGGAVLHAGFARDRAKKQKAKGAGASPTHAPTVATTCKQ